MRKVILFTTQVLVGSALIALFKTRFDDAILTNTETSTLKAMKEHNPSLLVVDGEILKTARLLIQGALSYAEIPVLILGRAANESTRYLTESERYVPYSSNGEFLLNTANEMACETEAAPRKRGQVYFAGLTKREYDVARLVARGMSNRDIARAAGLQEQSVKNLVSVVLRKLGCENRVQIALRLSASNTKSINSDAVVGEHEESMQEVSRY